MAILHNTRLQFADEASAKAGMPWAVRDGEWVSKGDGWDLAPMVAPWKVEPVYDENGDLILPGELEPGAWYVLLASEAFVSAADPSLAPFIVDSGRGLRKTSFATTGPY